MSEFVECQNCGKQFFAENIDCPYCGDEQELRDLMEEVSGTSATGHGSFVITIAVFALLVVALVLFSGWAWFRTGVSSTRWLLAGEVIVGALLVRGLLGRRRWSRRLAIAYILAHALLGIASIVRGGVASSLAWGPGPLVLLLFLLPFRSERARRFLCR